MEKGEKMKILDISKRNFNFGGRDFGILTFDSRKTNFRSFAGQKKRKFATEENRGGIGIGVLINLNSENEGGKEGKKEEEKLVYEGTTIMQTLIIQILRGAPTIPLAIHAPPRKLEFQEFEFLGEKISFQSSRFLIDR